MQTVPSLNRLPVRSHSASKLIIIVQKCDQANAKEVTFKSLLNMSVEVPTGMLLDAYMCD